MNRQRELKLALAFDADGEPVAVEGKSGRQEVKDVLESLHAVLLEI